MGELPRSPAAQALRERIESRQARVCVVGAGYVGLPLAVALARAGFHAAAFDRDEEKVRRINQGRSYVGDVADEALRREVAEGRLRGVTDPAVLAESDAVIICVPTPLRKTKDPDVGFVMDAASAVARHLHPGQLVVLESTTYPGFTREVLLPVLAQGGRSVGQDYFLAFSPERVDPGNRTWGLHNTPKIVGGTTARCAEIAATLYRSVVERVVPVSSTDAAEMAKLLENTFRAVNIGLVNEVAIMCRYLGLDTWEVIEAAATKPFGFMRFYPGPGLGGHCIPVDPLYLSWKLKTHRYNARFIELADQVNSAMPDLVVQLAADALNEERKALRGSSVLVLGVAYKRDSDDVRESPALDIIELLRRRGAEVVYHDPRVPQLRLDGERLSSVPCDELGRYDCVLITTDHAAIDYERVVREAKLVLDTRNATRSVRDAARARIIYL